MCRKRHFFVDFIHFAIVIYLQEEFLVRDFKEYVMKARITKKDNIYKIYFCTGLTNEYTIDEIKAFISDFKNEKHYKTSVNLKFVVNYEDLDGETIAYINDDYELCIVNDKLFAEILTYNKFNFISVKEYALKHDKSESIIKRHCREERIKGVVNIGSTWLIPDDAEYPLDTRVGRRV